MSAETKAIFCRYAEEIWNKRNVDSIDELIASNFIGRIAGAPDIVGNEGFKQFFAGVFAAFPDGQSTVEQMIAEGDQLAVRWTFRGTHKGQYLGIAPTGKYVTSTTTAIYRIANGKIVEICGETDALGLLQQLGGRSR